MPKKKLFIPTTEESEEIQKIIQNNDRTPRITACGYLRRRYDPTEVSLREILDAVYRIENMMASRAARAIDQKWSGGK